MSLEESFALQTFHSLLTHNSLSAIAFSGPITPFHSRALSWNSLPFTVALCVPSQLFFPLASLACSSRWADIASGLSLSPLPSWHLATNAVQTQQGITWALTAGTWKCTLKWHPHLPERDMWHFREWLKLCPVGKASKASWDSFPWESSKPRVESGGLDLETWQKVTWSKSHWLRVMGMWKLLGFTASVHPSTFITPKAKTTKSQWYY